MQNIRGHQALFLKLLPPRIDGLAADPEVQGDHLKGEKKDYGPHLPPEGSVTKGEGGAADLLEEFQKPLRPVLDGLTYIFNGGFSWW
jgi:hypothetical protein